MKIKKTLIEDIVDDLTTDEKPEIIDEDDTKSEIEKALDAALRASIFSKNGDWQNVLFIGEAGTGKTAQVWQWARKRGINVFSVKASSMDETDLGGAIAPDYETQTVKRFATTEFDKLDLKTLGDELSKPKDTILFLDELNRARRSVRGTLLTVIQDHTIPDARTETGERKLEGLLFTVACINPNDFNYNADELDDAERSRFRNVSVKSNPRNWLKWVLKRLEERRTDGSMSHLRHYYSEEELDKIVDNQKNLITALVSSPDFKFDNKMDITKSHDEGNGLILSPRSLTNCLFTSDGTKKDFLEMWDDFCNSLDKPMVERILGNYKDKDDKANDALKFKSERAKKLAKEAENDGLDLGNSDNSLQKLIDNNPELADIL